MATPAFNPSQRSMKPEAKKFLTWLFVLLVFGAVFAGYYIVNKTNLADSIVPGGTPSVSLPAILGGNKDNTINVCVVTWGGYAGGQYFNGGFTASKESRYYKEYGLLVDFLVMDDFVASRDAWKNGKCHLLWQTDDAFPTEAASLRQAGFDPQIKFQADWSRGGDAIVVAAGVKSMKDLRGEKIAVAYGTPSHTFLLRMLEASGMTAKDVQLVNTGDAIKAAEMFKTKAVKAATVWSPDDKACVEAVPGAKVLVSTKTASRIIADIFYADGKWASKHEKQLDDLIAGWMVGAAEINHDVNGARAKAVAILAKGLNIPEADAAFSIGNVRLATYGDNAAFFNLKGDNVGVTAERLYRESAQLYQANGFTDLVPSIPDWRQVSNLSNLRNIADRFTDPMHAAEEAPTFSAPTKAVAKAEAFTSKQLSVHFPVGSAVLEESAKILIEEQFVPTARAFATARIRIEGNTDSTGSAVNNTRLSRARAQAVAGYLQRTFGFDGNRFVVVGNGSDKPLCNDETSDCMARNRRTDFELIKAD
jgi:NitT/TauT family transport system substrate-binding protein